MNNAQADKGRIALIVLCLAAGSAAQAQDLRGAVAFFRHAASGTATIQVSVGGDVPAPGRYEVAATTDLIELLYLAGGPLERARTDREIRTIRVHLYRRTGDRWDALYEAPLDSMIGSATHYPELREDDLLRVETVLGRRVGWRDVLSVAGSIATLSFWIVSVAERL